MLGRGKVDKWLEWAGGWVKHLSRVRAGGWLERGKADSGIYVKRNVTFWSREAVPIHWVWFTELLRIGLGCFGL